MAGGVYLSISLFVLIVFDKFRYNAVADVQFPRDDVETGDLIHVEAEEKAFNPVAQILFKWRADVGAYIC